MSTVAIIAFVAANCIIVGIVWTVLMAEIYAGTRAEAAHVGSLLILPGLIVFSLGVTLAVVNGIVAVSP